MSEEKTLCKEGIVRAIHEDQVEVEITISSACSQCHARSLCIPSDHQQETVRAKPLYGEQFQVGDSVHLVLKQQAGRKAVVLAYFIPLIVLLVGLFGTYAITRNELAGVLVSLALVIVYFFILKQFRDKIDRNFVFYVEHADLTIPEEPL